MKQSLLKNVISSY